MDTLSNSTGEREVVASPGWVPHCMEGKSKTSVFMSGVRSQNNLSYCFARYCWRNVFALSYVTFTGIFHNHEFCIRHQNIVHIPGQGINQ